jgi:hypothetical protein
MSPEEQRQVTTALTILIAKARQIDHAQKPDSP